MERLKQLIAEVRFGETEADRGKAYKEALAVIDKNARSANLTTAEFERIANGMGLEVKKQAGGDVILSVDDELTVAHIGGKVTCDVVFFVHALKGLSFYTEDEIADIFGLVCEFARTPIEKRKDEK